MKISIDGKVVYECAEHAGRMAIDVEVSPEGEKCGPIVMTFRGGELLVRAAPDTSSLHDAALTIRAEDGGCLNLLGRGAVVFDCHEHVG